MNVGEVAFALLQPSNAVFGLLLLGFLVLLVWRSGGTVLVGLGVALLGILGLLPVGEAMLRPLESVYPPGPQLSDPAAIVLLGGYVAQAISPSPDDLPLNEWGERLVAAAVLARRFPEAKLVVTDGTNDPDRPSGAEASAATLEALGVPRAQLVLETRALSTWDNAVYSRALVPEAAGRPVVLVTSAWHMPRSMATFRAAGWTDLVAWPVDYATTYKPLAASFPNNVAQGLRLVDVAVREYLATAAYRFAGRLAPPA